MTGPGVGLLVELVKSCARLTLPADDQLSYVQNTSIDELALEFSDVAVLVAQFVAAGWLSKADADHISSMNSLLDEMSSAGKEHLWTEDGLRNSLEWAEIRHKARQWLVAIPSGRSR